MINGVDVSITPIDFEIIQNRKTYWVTLTRKRKYKGIEKEKKIDIGCFTFKKDEPDINEIYIYIGDDIRFSDSGTYRWSSFFKEEELEFLENLALNVLSLSIIMDEISSKKSKINKEENTFKRKDARDEEILKILKLF